MQLRKKNDSIIWAEISVGTLAEQEQTEISLIDITARKKAELNLYNLTFYDQLTGLPNSRVFSKRIRAEIIKIGRKRKKRPLRRHVPGHRQVQARE